MGVSKEHVESSLAAKLNPSHLLEGKQLLERHWMVNSALTTEMKEIHALSITKVLTPEQWKELQQSSKSQATCHAPHVLSLDLGHNSEIRCS